MALFVVFLLGAIVVVAFVSVTHRHASRSAATTVPAPGPSRPARPTVPSLPSPFSPRPQPGAPGAGASPDSSASLLLALSVRSRDVDADHVVAPVPNGNGVAGQRTLDLCQGTFTSEDNRTARVQVAELDSSGSPVFSTEAVLYDSAKSTALAFTELRTVAGQCTGGSGEKVTPGADDGWAQTATVQRLAYDIVTPGPTGPADHSIAVFLRRERLLVGLYFYQPQDPQPPIAGKTTMADIVTLFSERIAGLSPDEVNGTFS
jgi:hypothetical protein